MASTRGRPSSTVKMEATAAVVADTGKLAREGESSEEEGQIIDDEDDEPMEAEK